ncbi:MAG: hypothetical protein AB2992_00515 [Candidatus Symbiodolus clandestinus]
MVIHEIAHRFFADLLNIPVYRVNYFTLNNGNDGGGIELSPTDSVKAALLVALGPLIINTLLCAIISFPPASLLEGDENFLWRLLYWLGISIGMYAIPSNSDLDYLLNVVKQQAANDRIIKDSTINNPVSGSIRLLVFFIKIINLLRFLWVDLLYAVLISQVIPYCVKQLIVFG